VSTVNLVTACKGECSWKFLMISIFLFVDYDSHIIANQRMSFHPSPDIDESHQIDEWVDKHKVMSHYYADDEHFWLLIVQNLLATFRSHQSSYRIMLFLFILWMINFNSFQLWLLYMRLLITALAKNFFKSPSPLYSLHWLVRSPEMSSICITQISSSKYSHMQISKHARYIRAITANYGSQT